MRKAIGIIIFFQYLSLLGCSSGSEKAYLPAIHDIAFVSSDEAWLVTKDQNLFHLFGDGSRNKETKITAKVGSVDFRGHSGWALDVQGRIWSHDDRGWSLTSKDSVGFSPLSQVTYIDANIGWIRTLTELSLTEDGGNTWKKVRSTEPGILRHFFAADRDTAYLYGTGGTIERTTDRGRTWISVNLQVDSDVTAIACPEDSPKNCWTGTAEGEIFAVSESNTPVRTGRVNGKAIAVNSISFADKNNAVVAGMCYAESINDDTTGLLLITSDGGRTWRSIDVPLDKRFTKVRVFEGRVIWLASDSRVYRSPNMGETWMTLIDLQK